MLNYKLDICSFIVQYNLPLNPENKEKCIYLFL